MHNCISCLFKIDSTQQNQTTNYYTRFEKIWRIKFKKEKFRTWAPWLQVLRRAEKLPASTKSESPKACSSVNWIFESEAESGILLRVVVVVVVAALGDDGRDWGRPPSRPNSSSSRRSSSDWKAFERVMKKVRSKVTVKIDRSKVIVFSARRSNRVGMVFKWWWCFGFKLSLVLCWMSHALIGIDRSVFPIFCTVTLQRL